MFAAVQSGCVVSATWLDRMRGCVTIWQRHCPGGHISFPGLHKGGAARAAMARAVCGVIAIGRGRASCANRTVCASTLFLIRAINPSFCWPLRGGVESRAATAQARARRKQKSGLAAGSLTPLIFIPYQLFTAPVKAAAVSALTFAVTVDFGFALAAARLRRSSGRSVHSSWAVITSPPAQPVPNDGVLLLT